MQRIGLPAVGPLMLALEDQKALPENIPDLMISYVSALARPPISESPDIATVIWAAKIIAWLCVRTTFLPAHTSRSDVLKLLGNEKGPALLSYLKDKLRIVQVVGAAEDSVRFSLDPLAEYLAGLYVVEETGNDESEWKQFLEQADQKEGAPDAIRGFLLAVRDCCLAKPKDVPAFVADELAKRAGLIPEDRDQAYERRRTARMLAQMKSTSNEVRQAVIYAFFQLAPKEIAVVSALVEALDDDDVVVMNATNALLTIARSVLPPETIPDSDHIEMSRVKEIGRLTVAELQTK